MNAIFHSKFFIIFYFLISTPCLLLAQSGGIKVKVVDGSNGEPVSAASAALLNQNTQAYVHGTSADETGVILFEEISEGTYALRISFVGYQTKLVENLKVEKDIQDLGTIEMELDETLLEEITVEGQVPGMRLDIDRKVFDVSQSTISVGGSATDLLTNVPTLDVDADGNVSLRGSSDVKILIDGKESAVAGDDIAAYLQSLPADIIDKVELITNPSSRYDAEGQSGIINIVLKRNTRTDLNGSVNVSAGTYGNYMAGATFNYRDKKLNYNFGYNFNRRHSVGNTINDNQRLSNGVITDDSPRTVSLSENDRTMQSHTVRFGVDYYVAENSTLSFGSNLSFRKRNSASEIDYDYYNIPDYGANSFRHSLQNGSGNGGDFTLDFVQKLKREGEELAANVSFGINDRKGDNDYRQEYQGPKADLIRDNNTSGKRNHWNFQIDYVLPLGEDHKFEAGYRSIIQNSDESQFSYLQDSISHEMEPDYNLSNDFDMNDDIHALYVNYQRKLSEKIGMQVGLRGEQATLNTTYLAIDPDLSEEERVTPGKIDYFRLYPSVFLSYDVGSSGDKVQLNYSRRVRRPRGWQVNPFLNISDETNFSQGNPNLLPQDIHSLELGYSKFFSRWNFISSLYYRRENDMTSRFMHNPSELGDLVSDTTNITFSRWENVGDRDVLGVELIGRVDLTSWWDATVNGNLNYNTTHPFEDFDVQQVENFSWDANLTSNTKFLNDYSLQLRGFYRAPMKTLQGKMEAMYGMDLALKKEVLNKRGSVVFNVRDVFDSRSFRMNNYLPQSTVYMKSRWMPRIFSLSLTYRIGSQNNFRKERQSDYEGDGMGEEMQF